MNPINVELKQALALASRLKIYAYDAYIIASAQNEICELITLDSGLAYAAKVVGVIVVEVK